MALNPNIPLQAGTGFSQGLSQAAAIQQQQKQNRLAQLQDQEAMRQIQRENKMMQLAQQSFTPGVQGLPSAPGQGPMQPGALPLPDYPAQAGQAPQFDKAAFQNRLLGAGMLPEARQVQDIARGSEPGKDWQAWQPQLVNMGGKLQYAIPTFNKTTQKTEWKPLSGTPGVDGGQMAVDITPTEETPEQKRQRDVLAEAEKEKLKLQRQTDAAAKKEFEASLGKEGGKIYSNLQKSAQLASAFIPRLEGLQDLAASIETGKYAQAKMLAKQYLGVDAANMEVLNAKLGELAQDILNQQTGTKTDFDFQNAVRQSAALGKTPEANVRLIQALIERQKQAVNFGDQAREAYRTGGVKGVLDMRYDTGQDQPSAQIKFLGFE